eukprot:gene60007-82086_t
MIACQILITGLIARVANDSADPLRFLSDYRDEIKAVVRGINIAGIAGPTGGVEDISVEEWRRCLDIGLTGQFL